MKRSKLFILECIDKCKEMIILHSRRLTNETPDPIDAENIKYWVKKLEKYEHELIS
jgi:hypothetical protein